MRMVPRRFACAMMSMASYSNSSSGPASSSVSAAYSFNVGPTTRANNRSSLTRRFASLAEPVVNAFDGEVISFTNNLVAVRVSDQNTLSNNNIQSDGIATPAVSDGKAKKKRDDDMTGKSVLFKSKDGSLRHSGVIVCQRPPVAFVYLKDTDQYDDTSADCQEVTVSDTKVTIQVSDGLVGKVIDCFGNVLSDGANAGDGATTYTTTNSNEKAYERAIFATIPQVKDIALINSPLLTGVAMVDALAPIGKGQNMLVIGEKGTGKRDLVVDAVSSQVRLGQEGARCIYACTAPDKETRDSVLQRLREANVLDKITVVTLKGDHSSLDLAPEVSAEAVTVCGTACALAEAWAMNDGLDCLVVVDNLSSHKELWEHSSRTLVGMYGEESVVRDDRGASSEMRAYYSSLIQRSAQYNKYNGDGSVTLVALNELPGSKYDGDDSTGDTEEVKFQLEDFSDSPPKIRERVEQLVKAKITITPAILKKIQIPIPTKFTSDQEKLRQWALVHTDDLISMSDGQIWLSEDKFMNGQRPALDAQQSITRVGIGADTDSYADAPAIRDIVKGLRFEFNQAASLEGALNDNATVRQLRRFKAWLLAMHQSPSEIRDLAEECICMYAASIGMLDDVIAEGHEAGTNEGATLIQNLCVSVKKDIPEVLSEINSTQVLTDETKRKLEKAIKEFFPIAVN